ncbi:uncharacterized protein LOC122648839 [Telopea speciosissima]|uniref:uncharacterized protein LOC122648839 n=1 Tax=Telopea speciosissima TaxID=54955 RepID=UPI001CC6DFDE|nr:uncharacterized protein LOC122648839 [Telopea speciosissima]
METIKMMVMMVLLMMFLKMVVIEAADTNQVYQPCNDTTVQTGDGFTFGIAFAPRTNFYFNQTQLSPCDVRLSLSSANSQLAIFRPKVDEISLLTINTTNNFFPANYGGYMVAFAGRKYAAVSIPAFVANSTYIVTSFTLVLDFNIGQLQNLYWKTDGCASCSSNSSFVCLNNQDCAIKTSSCKGQGGSVDCSLGIQLAFSGIDKNYVALNTWYEVANLQQYSLYSLFSNLTNSLTSQFNSLFG